MADEFIVEYTLDDRKFQAGAKRVEQTTRRLGNLNRTFSVGGPTLLGGMNTLMGSSARTLMGTGGQTLMMGAWPGSGSPPTAYAPQRIGGGGMKSPPWLSGLSGAASTIGQFIGSIVQVAEQLFQALLSFTTRVGMASAALAWLAKDAIEAAADLDSLKKGLASMMGGMSQAVEEVKRLREVAKLPGIDLKSAIETSTVLQSSGLTPNDSIRVMFAFGNALAAMGRGAEDMDGLIRALQQIISKGQVAGQELMQLGERLPGIRGILRKVFGTGNSEELTKKGITPLKLIETLVQHFEKWPKVQPGPRTALENIGDLFFQMMAKIGDAINVYFLPAMQKIGDFIYYLIDLGKNNPFKNMVKSFMDMLGRIFGSKGGVIPVVATFIAALEKAPIIIEPVIMFLKDAWILVGKGALMVANIFYNVFLVMDAILSAIPSWLGGGGLFNTNEFKEMRDGFLKLLEQTIALGGSFNTFSESVKERAKQLQNDFEKAGRTGALSGDAGDQLRKSLEGKPFESKDDVQQIGTELKKGLHSAFERKVERDTGRFALGGNDIGALGVSLVELHSKPKTERTVRVKVENTGDLVSFMQRVLQQFLNEAIRQGAVVPGRG